LKIDYVIISTLRRTFDTIYTVFKKEISEKKQTFKIQLIPVINEFGNVAADIPSALNDKDREEVFKSNVDLQ